MGLLKEDISRIKEIMGIDEEPNDIDAVEGEIGRASCRERV